MNSEAAAGRDRALEVQTQPGQVGVLVLNGGQLIALELLATPGLWSQVAPRTLRALLTSEGARRADGAARDPGEWLANIADRCAKVSPGVGLGSDVAVTGDGFAGSGLWHGQSMAHLAVFGSN